MIKTAKARHRITGTSWGLKPDSGNAKKYMQAAEIIPKTPIKARPCLKSLWPTPYSFRALYLAICLAIAPGMPAVEMIMNRL